ncbi:Sensory histidine kinase in two-component regulatory system with RstA [Grimontia indica]|uniref:histidine kinase n=2 Tax=Grimontia indica TaxID=1056512 RepID=R1GUE9_9GAMM|nr:ATP-binding protein [Grimontia sp. SpTr1]EOD79674.1 Sensory histidine kinase in two-component regulatory system with RstA [Grimontia indica]
MWRIYIESFIGLFVLFIVSSFAFNLFVYELTTDYDYVLEDMEAAAFQNLVNTLHEQHDDKAIKQLLAEYAQSTANTLNLVHADNIPAEVKDYFSGNNIPHPFSFLDENRGLWFTLSDSPNFYHLAPDIETLVRQKIEFSDSLFFVFILGGFLVYSTWLIWFLSRRVRVLQRVTADFAKGNLNARAPTNSGSKVGKLNDSFNEMADKISLLITSNRSLTQAVAHDLRTPIFRIQWQAELIKEEAQSEELRKKVTSIIEDTEEMEQLVDELLYFAKIGRQDRSLTKETLPAAPFIQHLVERLPNRQNREIEVIIEPDISLLADKPLLKRAIENILTNAVRYAESTVTVICQQNGNTTQIIVEDDGPGIPEEYRESVFEPFFSVDPSRNKANMGHGLGLAIVKLIVEKHDGHAVFEESAKGGAKLIVTIPNQRP